MSDINWSYYSNKKWRVGATGEVAGEALRFVEETCSEDFKVSAMRKI